MLTILSEGICKVHWNTSKEFQNKLEEDDVRPFMLVEDPLLGRYVRIVWSAILNLGESPYCTLSEREFATCCVVLSKKSLPGVTEN